MRKKVKKKRRISMLARVITILVIFIFIVASVAVYEIYKNIYQPNVILKEKKTAYLYIPTGATFEDVVKLLVEHNYIKNRSSFEWLAEMKNYPKHIYPGRYKITDSMNNNQLVNMLRSGIQTPVTVTINIIRTKYQLAGVIARELEPDSADIISLLNDNTFLSEYGFNSENVLSMFLPNSYQFYWNTSSQNFFKRMYKEYKKFWTPERINRAKTINLTPFEVSILASIVQEETIIKEEKPIVAGVYINRLHKGLPLQADPTVRFATQNYSKRRIDLKFDSPYNTYLYTGLPPGPICLPNTSSLYAVLYYAKHDYIYFCAKEDFSGYHNFSKTYDEHLINAKRYHKALTERGYSLTN